MTNIRDFQQNEAKEDTVAYYLWIFTLYLVVQKILQRDSFKSNFQQLLILKSYIISWNLWIPNLLSFKDLVQVFHLIQRCIFFPSLESHNNLSILTMTCNDIFKTVWICNGTDVKEKCKLVSIFYLFLLKGTWSLIFYFLVPSNTITSCQSSY